MDPELPPASPRRPPRRHPVGHPGEPDDIARGIVCLAGDEATFLTGTEPTIDGGHAAR